MPIYNKDCSFINLPDNIQMILSVGPLKTRKGMDILIKSFSKVIKIIKTGYLVIVGSGETRQYMDLAKLLGISNYLRIINNISSEQLSSLFYRCDLFALTPRYINHEFEGYGLVYLEAGLYKKPVVGSLSGGVPEAVINNETGILVPEKDERATAEAIIKILKDRQLAERLGNNGFKLAVERNWDDYIKKIINIYNKYK